MPELAHEIPTEEEHWAYLQEHITHSAFAPFWMTPEELEAYPDIAASLRTLSLMNGRGFAGRAVDGVWQSLRRMNQLPRTHAFWDKTNNRPTFYKVGDFCTLELTADPWNQDALWTRAVLPTWMGANSFGETYWLKLAQLPGFDIQWPLCAALITNVSASSTSAGTNTFLRQANAVEPALVFLHQIASSGEGIGVTWAKEVLALLQPDYFPPCPPGT